MTNKLKGFVVAAVWLAACGRATNGRQAGGESHFLHTCAEGCGSLECVADLCTRSCLVDHSSCSDLSPGASCTNTSAEPGAIAICDSACSIDSDCSALGEGFSCSAGFCRSTASPPAAIDGASGADPQGPGLDLGGTTASGGAGGTNINQPVECRLSGNTSPLGSSAMTCAERPETACSPIGVESTQDALDQQLDDVIMACGSFPTESAFEAAFTDGCATALTASISGPPSSSKTALIDCIGQALDSARFACAQGLECARARRSTLP